MAEDQSGEAAPPESLPPQITHEPFTVKVLSLVQVQQNQNGLRHNDHLRYRQYCSRRLRRLYKGLNFKHGKGRFKNVAFPEDFQDARFLEVLIVQCERAWSYGVQLKADNANASTTFAMWRRHSIRRFAKAVKIGRQLEAMFKTHTDQLSQMHAEAYCALLEGFWLCEKEKWKEALARLVRCKRVCEHLALAAEPQESTLFKLKVQEISPMIRECRYNLGLGYDGADDDDASKKVIAPSRKDLSELNYRGHGLAMPSDKIKAQLMKCIALVAGVKDMDESGDALDKYSEIAAEFSDALGHIHSDMIDAGADGQTDEWRMLEAFARELSVCVNLERNLVLLRKLFDKFDGTQEVASSEARRLYKPDEGMRFCDLLKADVDSLLELPMTSEAVSKTLALYLSVIKNCRSLFLALCNVQLGKMREAAALMDLLHSRIEDLQLGDAQAEPLGRLHPLVERVLKSLPSHIGKWRCRILAQLCMETTQAQRETPPPAADVAQDFAALGAFPPKFRDIPCKPLLFDLAYQCLEEPDLSEFLPKAGETKGSIIGRVAGGIGSRFGGLFGGRK